MTYSIELTDKPDKRGLHHVMIRLHAKGHNPARIQTSIEIQKKHWNDRKEWGKWVRSSFGDKHKEANQTIADQYQKIKNTVEKYLEADAFLSPKRCKLRYDSGTVTLLKDLIEQSLSTDLSGQTKSARTYQYNAFIRWAGADISVEQINSHLIEDYKNFLLGEGKEPSTINIYISGLRILYERAQQARGLTKREIATKSPFIEWVNLSTNHAPKGRLAEPTIDKLVSAPFDLTFRKTGSRLFRNYDDWARWCWLACLMQAGMRIGDLIRSRYEWYEVDSEGYPTRLRYQMQKNGKWISIPISKALRTHLALVWVPGSKPESYLLPFLDPNEPFFKYRSYEQIRAMPEEAFYRLKTRMAAITCQLNRGLKNVTEQFDLHIPGGATLTNHTARHSFADKVRMAIKTGKRDAKGRAVTNFDAKELLGHADMKTTEMYFGEMDQDWLDSAMDAITGDD